MEEDLIPVRRVRYGPPKTSLKNANIESALINSIVPAIVQDCTTMAVRSIFDFSSYEDAVKQLAARRKKMEDVLKEMDCVSLFFVNIISWITYYFHYYVSYWHRLKLHSFVEDIIRFLCDLMYYFPPRTYSLELHDYSF